MSMASCSSSSSALVLPRGHFHVARAGRPSLRHQAVSFRNGSGLQWMKATQKPSSRRTTTAVACAENPKAVIIDTININNSSAESVVEPRRKRGRPKKANITGQQAGATGKEEEEEEEEEWDFFGELATQIETGGGGADLEEDSPNVVAETAPEKTNAGSSTKIDKFDDRNIIPEAAAAAAASPSSFGGRQGSKEQSLREEDTGSDNDDDEDDVDFDDPKYQQKPDWMQDAVWKSINNQATDDDDEGQPLWVDEEDPNWPEEEPEDGWGFRTSQFFDKVSIKTEKSAEDGNGGDDDEEEEEELRLNWENEADDWMIQEITSADWEVAVFANPSPLVVYVFARYGRRGMDSWKTLEQLEKAVTQIWESNKAPLRAVKVDVGMEIDLGSALGINKDECPQLLFVKNGKGLYRLKEQRTAEELVQLIAHFFYNGSKPACLKTTSNPEDLKNVG